MKMRSGDKTEEKSGVVETLKTLFIAGLIAVSFRSVVAEPFNIPSGSMIPTLLVGDYLFVSKFSYGYSRHSFPFSIAPISGRVMASTPERGDVAVFRLPSDVSVDYIKRVVGLPGDRIQVKDGILHINGQPVERRFVGNGKIGSSQSGFITHRYAPFFLFEDFFSLLPDTGSAFPEAFASKTSILCKPAISSSFFISSCSFFASPTQLWTT